MVGGNRQPRSDLVPAAARHTAGSSEVRTMQAVVWLLAAFARAGRRAQPFAPSAEAKKEP
jgi:hypothetical protein